MRDRQRLIDVHTLPIEPLSERERQVLILLQKGLSNKEIGDSVYVSENTIKFHLKKIYLKLGVNGRVQAACAARQIGLE